ncbi:hypothetical protein V1477_008046 [Vespula maculifrons]|uniref:Uncharacterized protein n=1 Tax=Vespula maculifrons TaxID=7453 RepID=A0ABD2CFD6_VESMC
MRKDDAHTKIKMKVTSLKITRYLLAIHCNVASKPYKFLIFFRKYMQFSCLVLPTKSVYNETVHAV